MGVSSRPLDVREYACATSWRFSIGFDLRFCFGFRTFLAEKANTQIIVSLLFQSMQLSLSGLFLLCWRLIAIFWVFNNLDLLQLESLGLTTISPWDSRAAGWLFIVFVYYVIFLNGSIWLFCSCLLLLLFWAWVGINVMAAVWAEGIYWWLLFLLLCSFLKSLLMAWLTAIKALPMIYVF